MNFFKKMFSREKSRWIDSSQVLKLKDRDLLGDYYSGSVTSFIKSLSEKPTEKEVDALKKIACSHTRFGNRAYAIDYLGQKGLANDILDTISLTDEHLTVRLKADRWVHDYEGEMLKYNCENEFTENEFGRGLGYKGEKFTAIVGAIDSKGYNDELCMVGLSAYQLGNLGLRDRSRTKKDYNDLMNKISRNEKGLLDGSDYGDLFVSNGSNRNLAQVYNAFGVDAIGGCGVRISSILAENLGLKRGDEILISK